MFLLRGVEATIYRISKLSVMSAIGGKVRTWSNPASEQAATFLFRFTIFWGKIIMIIARRVKTIAFPFEADRKGSSWGASEAAAQMRTSNPPPRFHARPAFCLAERALILRQRAGLPAIALPLRGR